jgi:hypothetical protein
MWLSRRSMLPWSLALALVFAPACADEEDPDARSEDELRALVIRRTAVGAERYLVRRGEG